MKKSCQWQVFSKKGASVSDAKSGGVADSIPLSPPKIDKARKRLVDFIYSLLSIHYSLLPKNDINFWRVISNSAERGK